MTKIVQIQYSMESGGKSALKLHNTFIEAGIESKILSLYPGINGNEKIKILGKKSKYISILDDKIQEFLTRKRINKFGLFSFPVLGTNISRMDEIRDADIIYLHWILGGFLNIKNIKQLVNLGKPVVFIMHDMWTITGGCHYSFSCDKYIVGCNNCPMFLSERQNDLSAKEYNKKLKLFSTHNNLYFVSPSKWLYNCAKKSILTKSKPIFHIPNIIENKIFKPFNTAIAKQILNIDPTETVLAFGATSINSPYKGWSYLQNALNKLDSYFSLKNITVVIFGNGYDKRIADAIPFKTKFMGYLKDNLSINIVYNAADIFIAPSLADNLPTTILESLSSGTAVVAFDTGGIADMISHKENGYLAKYKDSEDIANGIKYCLENKLKGYLLSEFEPNKTLNKHLELFDYIRSNSKK